MSANASLLHVQSSPRWTWTERGQDGANIQFCSRHHHLYPWPVLQSALAKWRRLHWSMIWENLLTWIQWCESIFIRRYHAYLLYCSRCAALASRCCCLHFRHYQWSWSFTESTNRMPLWLLSQSISKRRKWQRNCVKKHMKCPVINPLDLCTR